jgi:hypothetical protein
MKNLRLLSTLCACTVTLLSLSANAALVDADWKVMDDDLLTVDTVSQLAWLDITKTGGMSRDDVLAEMASGGVFAGFRYATSAEVIDLWSQYGIPLVSGEQTSVNNSLDPNIQTAAEQLGNLYGQAIASSDFGTLGLIAVDMSSPGTTSGWTGAFRQSGNSYYDGPTRSSVEFNDGKNWLGSYIVTTVVPVPGAFWLMLSGLLGFIGIARKKSA